LAVSVTGGAFGRAGTVSFSLDECGELELELGLGVGGGFGATAAVQDTEGPSRSGPRFGVAASVEGGTGRFGGGFSDSITTRGRETALSSGYGFGLGAFAGLVARIPL